MVEDGVTPFVEDSDEEDSMDIVEAFVAVASDAFNTPDLTQSFTLPLTLTLLTQGSIQVASEAFFKGSLIREVHIRLDPHP